MIKNKLGKNALLNCIYNLISMVFPLVTATYISRILLPEGVGLISYISNIAGYFVTVAPMGITTYGIKAISQCEDRRERNVVFSDLFFINAVSTILVSGLYILMIFLFPYFRENLLLYIIAGINIFSNILNVEWLYRGIEDYKYITIRNFIVKLFSAIAIFLFVKTKDDIYVYMLIICGVSSCNNLFNIIHARKYVRLNFDIDIQRIVKYLKPLLILLISLIAGEIYLKMDVTMLGILTNNENVGYYSSALKIINMVLIAITSITAVSLPRLAQQYKEGNQDQFQHSTIKLLKPIVIFSSAACLGLSLVAKDLVIVFFGVEFEQSFSVVIILSLLFMIKGIGDLLCYQVVIATGSEKILPGVRISSVFVNFILNFILIIFFQHNGAAIATVITELFTLICIMFMMRKKIKIKLDGTFIFSVLVSNICMVFAIIVVQRTIGNIILRLLFSVLIGASVYFICLMIVNKLLCKRNRERKI